MTCLRDVCFGYARLCSGGNVTSRRRFETSLFSSVRRLLLVNTESSALLFDERRTRRERKERESFILLSSIARIKSIHSFGKRARRSRPIAFRGNQSNGSNHIEKSKRLHTHTHKVIMATKVQRIMTQPINLIFRFLQTKSRVQIWLYEHAANGDVLEGQIVGFDEYMNLVLDDCEEVKRVGGAKQRTSVGRVLLKGDSVTMMVKVDK
jgi:small nuclear ribonucleoprotein E